MITVGTTGAGVATVMAGLIPIGDGTDGAMVAMVMGGTTGVMVASMVVTTAAGTIGVGEVTDMDMPGTLITGMAAITETEITATTLEDEDITIIIRLQVIAEVLHLGVDRT